MVNSTTNDSTMVSLGKFKVGGYAYWAPAGTTLPTDSATALPAEYKLLGYLSEDGLTNTTDTDTAEIKDANGTTVMKIITSYAESYQFALLEVLRAEAAKLRYNSDAVTGNDKSMTIKHQMPSDEDFVLVFEIAMSGDVKDRLVIGNATRAEFGDRQVHAGDPQVTSPAPPTTWATASPPSNTSASPRPVALPPPRPWSARSLIRSTATRPPKPAKGPRPPNNGSSRVMRSTTSP